MIDLATATANLNSGGLTGSVLEAAKTSLANAYAKSPNGPTPIAVSSLNTTPQPATAPVVAPGTAAPALAGHITATQDAFTQSLDQNAQVASTAKNTSLDALIAGLKSAPGQAALTDQAYAGGVDPLSKELADINNQITAEQVSARHAAEALQANPGGLSTDALNANVANIQRQSLSKQADLAVIQMAKQGQFDSAKAIADRAVAVQVEQQKQKVDALQLAYSDNKALFTTAEQRQFETAQADRQRQLDQATYEARAKYDQIIKQNDPLYKAQLANTYSEIAARGAAIGQTLNGKAQTSTEAQVQGYADRTNQADITLSKLGSIGTSATKTALGSIPFVGNYLTGGDYQQLQQAQRNFVNAVLRRESGAAISPSEFQSAAQQYFPQPGDTPENIAQKAANRQTVINSLYQQGNVQRTLLPGQIVEKDGKQYIVQDDGQTLLPYITSQSPTSSTSSTPNRL